MKKKRGQLTIFIILGIVLLFAFGFLFFVRNIFFEAKIEAESQTKLQEVFQSEAFKTYSSSCLDEVSKEAILLIGKQGGNIEPEGKFLPVQDNNKNISVSYGITWEPTEPDFLPPGAFTSLPEYPRYSNIFAQSYFGNNNLPYLCQPEGPNQEAQGDIKRETCTFLDLFVKPGYGPNSIQEQLSLYIADKLEYCINLSDIPSLAGLTVKQGDYSVEVILGKDDVKISAVVPLFLEGEAMTQTEFTTTVNARLKPVYELAHAIVEQDKKWLGFEKNVSQGSGFLKKLQTLEKIKGGFTISLSCPYCDYEDDLGYNYDDLIKIIDSNSKIGKEPFVFMFALENRIPILEDISYYNPFDESPLNTYDIIVASNQKILIEPEGYDPDEDDLNYAYEGWREEYYTEFDLDCCIQFGGDIDCRKDHITCVERIDIPKPRNWTQSFEFQTTNKTASYIPALTEVGLHNLTVKNFDGQLSDWQDLTILVVDTPAAVGSGFNNYSTIENSKASIEDSYYLNATASISILLDLKEYDWYDKIEPFAFEGIPNPIFRLPYADYNITNIKSKNFNTTALDGITHIVNLTVSNRIITSEKIGFNVSVYQCLPYRNSGTAPYPYNNLGIVGFDNFADIEDPFLADHTCCKDDYNYEDINEECYRHTEYGTYQYIKNNPLTDAYLPGTSGVEQQEIGIPEDYGYQNDVYTRVFTRDCSGDRGNICTGERNIDISYIESCHNECERPGSYTNSNQATVPGPISCQNVGGSNYVVISGDGFNVVGGRCSENSALYSSPWHTYDGDDKVRCKYACSTTGCNQEVDCECKPEYVAQGYCYYPIGCIADESCHPSGNKQICEHGVWQYDVRCDDCGHVCDSNDYGWQNPCCLCNSGGCPGGYDNLGKTSDCDTCCATHDLPECP